ncbi:MAG: hypothetical protein U9P72_02920, partial [Campylobacterota bacterium]|nr:hypothetical protein [Campylobacterota bacterium]
MKNSLLSLAVIALLGFTGCIDSDEEGVDTVNSIETTDITVERGPVYGATVTDATGKIAQQKDGENVYTFIGEITYPITANGGWIDLDGDGMMGSYDIELAMELKSYSNVLTPITTYIADSSEEKREEKLEELLTLINNSSDSEITAQELLKVPSQTSQKAQMTINAVYAEMLENDSVTIDTDDILGRINEFENLDLPENLSAQDRAEMYEEYLVYSSDLVSEFAEC